MCICMYIYIYIHMFFGKNLCIRVISMYLFREKLDENLEKNLFVWFFGEKTWKNQSFFGEKPKFFGEKHEKIIDG